jgi:hypothetical protein
LRTKLLPKLAATTILAILPSYLTELVTEHYFLTSSPAFGAWSGDRMEISREYTRINGNQNKGPWGAGKPAAKDARVESRSESATANSRAMEAHSMRIDGSAAISAMACSWERLYKSSNGRAVRAGRERC